MDEQKSTSGVNTILIVIVLLLLVGFGVWWFATRESDSPSNQNEPASGINVDVNFPGGQENENSDEGAPQ